MQTTKSMTRLFMALMVVSVLTASARVQTIPTDPRGGMPAKGSKPSVEDLDYQVKYQRSFEAVIWSMSAVSGYQLYRAAIDNGAKPNTVMAFSKPATQKAEFLTANNVTPYILSQTDLRKGPVVIDVPKATDKANLFGQIVDHWQITIADIGPVGVDKGKGAKILLTPPGYDKKIPSGYTEIKSPSYHSRRRSRFTIWMIRNQPSSLTRAACGIPRSLAMTNAGSRISTRLSRSRMPIRATR